MASVEVTCALCKGNEVRKHGKLPRSGTQRYICFNDRCRKKTFILHYKQLGKDPKLTPVAFKKKI